MWLFGYSMICFSFLQAGGGTQSYLRYMKIWNMKYENLKHEIWKIETINWEKVTLQLLAIFSARGKYVALSSAPTKKSSLPYFLVIFPCHIFVPYFLAIFPCHICVPYFLAIFLSEGNILRFIQEVFSTAGLLSSSIDAMNTFLTDVSRCLPLLPSPF